MKAIGELMVNLLGTVLYSPLSLQHRYVIEFLCPLVRNNSSSIFLQRVTLRCPLSIARGALRGFLTRPKRNMRHEGSGDPFKGVR